MKPMVGSTETTSVYGRVVGAFATALVVETVTTSRVKDVPSTPAALGEGSTTEDPAPQPHQRSDGTTTPRDVSTIAPLVNAIRTAS